MEKVLAKVVPADKTERGATMIEYAVIAALIAVVCIAGVAALGDQAKDNLCIPGATMGVAAGASFQDTNNDGIPDVCE